jgi:hypothetical protein
MENLVNCTKFIKDNQKYFPSNLLIFTFLVIFYFFETKVPLGRTIVCAINLVNQTDSYSAFKLKTTSPKRYTVKPKDGIVAPHEIQKIEVTLHQDVKEIPEDDKFRLESVRILNSSMISEKNAINDAVSFSRCSHKVFTISEECCKAKDLLYFWCFSSKYENIAIQ